MIAATHADIQHTGRGLTADDATLGRRVVAAVDTTGQAAEICDLGTHLRDALRRVDSAGLADLDSPDALVIAGMGGSAAGGRLALDVLADRARRPLAIVDGYTLPPWVRDGTLVLCSSYSGTTEETLACYDAARASGAAIVAATTGGPLADRARRDGVPIVRLPGGLQPRAAVGYALVTALEAAVAAGVAPSLRNEVKAAARLADTLAAEWDPNSDAHGAAKTLARRLHGTVPVVIGAELTAHVAYRWKCQLNENAKLPAFSSHLPEAHHNEACGWASAGELGAFSVVLLEDPAAHPRMALRCELTAALVAPGARVVERVAARGETRLERLISLVLLGDLVSLYLAVLRGVDPVSIEAIDALKAQLAKR
jgi:glucose/mannose-6-phosphate isomerase